MNNNPTFRPGVRSSPVLMTQQETLSLQNREELRVPVRPESSRRR